jgi:ParB family chromosome partitioning protein
MKGGGRYEVRSVSVGSIIVGDQMVRVNAEDDSIIELGNDIAAHGLLQAPGVREMDGGQYQLLWGSRRLAACRRLGWSSIPAHVYDRDDVSVKAVALVENLHRQNLTLEEEVEAVRHMHEVDKKSPDQISALISKGRSWVMSRLSVLAMPEFMREPLLEGLLKMGQLEEISRVSNEGAQRYLVSQCQINKWTRSQVRAVVQGFLDAPANGDLAAGDGESSAASVNYAEPSFLCEACGKRGPLSSLVLVRVCAGGCPVSAESGGGEKDETEKGVKDGD